MISPFVWYDTLHLVITAPSESPRAFRTTLVHSTNISVQWERVNCRDRNSEISHYALRFSMSNESEENQREVNVLGVGDTDRMYNITRLQPLSVYTVSIAAVNTNGERGPNTSIAATTNTPESKLKILEDCLFRA